MSSNTCYPNPTPYVDFQSIGLRSVQQFSPVIRGKCGHRSAFVESKDNWEKGDVIGIMPMFPGEYVTNCYISSTDLGAGLNGQLGDLDDPDRYMTVANNIGNADSVWYFNSNATALGPHYYEITNHAAKSRPTDAIAAESNPSAAITTAATSFSVTSGEGAKFPAASASGDDFLIEVTEGNKKERMRVTARATDALTVTRGLSETTAQAFTTAAKVKLLLRTWTPCSDSDRRDYDLLNLPSGQDGAKAWYKRYGCCDYITLTITNKNASSQNISNTDGNGKLGFTVCVAISA